MLYIKTKRMIMLLFAIMVNTVSFGQDADSLNHYLETAARNNMAVKAAFHTYEASLQKVSQAGSYEDPKLDIGVFLEPMEIVSGKQVAQFQLMQMFPWFGTRKAAKTEMQHMAKMAFEQFRETRDKLYLEVYTQWYLLCRLQQKRLNNEKNLKLLKQLEELALRKFSSGGNFSGSNYSTPVRNPAPVSTSTSTGSMVGMGGNGSNAMQSPGNTMGSMRGAGNMSSNMGQPSSGMSEVLRVQLEIAELESNIESLLSEMVAEKVRFNALLNRPAESEIIVPDKLSQIPFVLDTEAAFRAITEQNPMLGMLKEESLAYDAKTKMIDKMGYPMLGIGLQYMLINKKPEEDMDMGGMLMDTGMDDMNGKDMIMPMVSVTIPIFRKKYNAAKKEAKIQQQAVEAEYANTFYLLEADLSRSKHQLDDATRKIVLYRKQAVLARTTYDLMLQEFISNKSDLGSIIQVQRQLLDYQLNEAEAIADYNTMVASVQKLISNLSPVGR